MALRARELFYFVRVGNYASRPLRELEADFRRLGATSAASTAKLQGAQAAQTQALRRLDKQALNLRAFTHGARMAQYASGALVAGFGLAAHAAADFQTDAAQVATQVGNTGAAMARAGPQIQKGIIEQMKRFPAAAKEMTDASYDIFSSLTLQGDQQDKVAAGMTVLDVANRASVAGMTSLEDATSGIVVLLNTFAKGTQSAAIQTGELDSMLNTAFATVRFGRLTFGEYTQALATTAPAAKSANQSLGDMSGTLAFLTRRMPVRQAAVSYARLLEVLQRSAKGLKKTGVDVRDAAGQMRPLSDIITDIAKKNPDLVNSKKFITDYFKSITKGAGSGTIGTIQARRAFVFLVRQWRQYHRILDQVNSAQGQFAESYENMRKTAGIRWDIAMNRLHAMALEIGATAIPVFEKLLRPVQRALEWFNNLDRGTKEHLTTMIAWGAAAVLLISTIGVLVGSLGSLVIGFTAIAETGALAAMIALAPEIVIVAAAVTALFLAWRQYPNEVEGAITVSYNVARALASIGFNAVITWLRRMAAPIEFVITMMGLLVKAGQGLWGQLRRLLGPLRSVWRWMNRLAGIKPIRLVINIVFNVAKSAAQRAISLLKKIPGGKYAASLIANAVGLGGAYRTIKGGVDTVRDLIPGLGGGGGDSKDLTHSIGSTTRLRSIMKGPTGPAPKVAAAQAAAAAKARRQLDASAKSWVSILLSQERYVKKHPAEMKGILRLGNLRAQMEKKFGANRQAAIEQIVAYELSQDDKAKKKRIKNAKDANKQIVQDRKAAVDQMKSMYDDLLKANEDAFGDITAQPLVQNMMEAGLVPKFRDYMGDITSQLTKFTDFRKEITRGRQILPKKLLEQIQAKGIEAEPFLAGLLNLTPKQRAQYIKVWKRAQAEIRKATMSDLHAQLNDRLKAWRNHGKSAAKAFINGMKDEQPWLNKQMNAIFTQWMQSHPAAPSRQGRPGRKTKTAAARPRTTRKTQASHVTHNHNNNQVHVHNVREDLSTTLRKARLHQKQKSRRMT